MDNVTSTRTAEFRRVQRQPAENQNDFFRQPHQRQHHIITSLVIADIFSAWIFGCADVALPESFFTTTTVASTISN
jgi:hypothetical protein